MQALMPSQKVITREL